MSILNEIKMVGYIICMIGNIIFFSLSLYCFFTNKMEWAIYCILVAIYLEISEDNQAKTIGKIK